MEAIEAILTRRSIRRYKTTKISKSTIEALLNSAMHAPSARNQQIWRFVVVNDIKLLKKLGEAHPYWRMMSGATLGIAVCADLSNASSPGYFEQDCGAATQNLLLSAHALGIGTVWLGVHPNKERVDILRNMLKIPTNIIPFSLISLGYPDETIPPVNRYDNTKVHYNKW